MDLKQLEYFVRVAEFGSFTRAAAFLGIAQPALSRQVRLLEVELRQALLIRNGRGVVATDAGRLLLSHGLGILQQVDHVKEALEAQRGATVGRVVIAMPPSAGKLLAVSTVKAFQERFPKAALGVVEGLSAHIAEWLQIGRVDIGLIYNPIPSPGMEIIPLMEEELYLMRPAPASKKKSGLGKPVRLDELPRYPLVIPSRPHSIRMLIETQMAHAGLRMNVQAEVDGISAILDLVSQGVGYAVLPINALHTAQLESAIQAHPIVQPRIVSVLTLARSQQRPATPLVTNTVDLLLELVKQHTSGSAAKPQSNLIDLLR
ncbi:MAG: LysR family transcriptional regulator [Pseudomonadota bacterium]